MADLNKVFLMGRLTRDPELRRTPTGTAVVDLGIVTNKKWTDKQGEVHEDPVFIECAVWDRQAETCCQYLRKGSSVHVEAELKMEKWTDKNSGEPRSKLKLDNGRVQFLDGKPKDGNGQRDEPRDERPARREAVAAAPPARAAQPPMAPDEIDDIPFKSRLEIMLGRIRQWARRPRRIPVTT